MKGKWISLIVALALVAAAFAALPAPKVLAAGTTYTWNQTGTASWAVSTNWTPTRTTPATSDILVFDGGGAVTVTNVPAETIGQLLLSNSTTVNLQAAAANTLTIGGDTGTDLDVPSGSALNMNGASALTILVGTGATGSVSGSMTCSAAQSRLNAADASAITFNSGAVFTQAALCIGNVFTAAGTANVIVFASGSTFVSQTGSNPFGLGQPSSKVVFQSGSLFRHEQAGTPAFSGRTYANFELNFAAASITGTGGSALSIDNLTVTDGTLNMNMTGTFNLKGNISVAAGETLTFNPATTGTLIFNGSSQQSISGAGTLTFAALQNVALNNASGLLLNRDVTLNGTLALTSGDITTGANTLTLAEAVTTSGNGDVWGNVKRTGALVTAKTYSFGNPNVSLTFASGTLPTDVTMTIAQSQPSAFTYAITRSYSITPNGGSGYSATVRLHYLDGELNGNTEATLVLWRYDGSQWLNMGQSSRDSTNNWVEQTGITTFSPWAISSFTPTAVTLHNLHARAPLSPWNVALPLLGLVAVGGLVAWRRRG